MLTQLMRERSIFRRPLSRTYLVGSMYATPRLSMTWAAAPLAVPQNVTTCQH